MIFSSSWSLFDYYFMLLLFFSTLTLFFSYKYYPDVRVSSSIVSLSVQSKRASYLPLIRISTLKWKVSHIDLCTTFLSSIPSYLSFFNPFQPSFLQCLPIFLSWIPFYFSNRFFCLVCSFLYLLYFQYWCFYTIFLFHNWYRFNFSIYLSIFLKVLYLYLYDFIFYFYECLENEYKLLQLSRYQKFQFFLIML